MDTPRVVAFAGAAVVLVVAYLAGLVAWALVRWGARKVWGR
jgi:hypothetical protein